MDQKRKEDYTKYFNSHLEIVEKYRDKFEESVECVSKECTCITHAQEESCNIDCDNDSWHKPLKR